MYAREGKSDALKDAALTVLCGSRLPDDARDPSEALISAGSTTERQVDDGSRGFVTGDLGNK